ncbi:hypothetical protein [Pseudodesulfovibrio tunisiensis]|uniref:hypothetical protein n=1 Tax=Pseudodesulfovibrio tunisiensis TaxID=463192 RepID=UPI001FB56B0A|nr:hypothetical protein [Pseudodesulfovibrio tunisiensis]
MASKERMNVILTVAYKQGGTTMAPGSRVELPVKQAQALIDNGHALDPGSLFPEAPEGDKAVKVFKDKIAELQASLKQAKAAKAEADTLLAGAESGLKSLSRAVLDLDPEAKSLPDSVAEMQEKLRTALSKAP